MKTLDNFRNNQPDKDMLKRIRRIQSSERAELTDKRHDHVLRDCDILNENYEKLAFPKIGECDYRADNGQVYREYRLTRIQTFDLMTGL